jgi:hypothetical protein
MFRQRETVATPSNCLAGQNKTARLMICLSSANCAERPHTGAEGKPELWLVQPSSVIFVALGVCAALGVALWMIGY